MSFSILKHLPNSIFLVAFLFVGLIPFSSEARTVVRSGNTISIGQDQVIEGDFYTAGNIVTISGQVQEDLLVAGTEVNVNGQIGADVLVLGANVDINGTVGDDLRILGGNIIIAEPVLGDVFVIGGNIKILSSASVTGDVTIIGGSAVINGPVEGRVLGWLETLRIDSSVVGDVEVTATTLTLGDNANIGGDIKYVSQTQLTRSQSATVDGEIVRNDPVIESGQTNMTQLLMPLLVILFSVALWYLLSRRLLQRVVNRTLMPGLRPVLIGGLVMILAPFAISILLVSMLGTFAGIAVLATYILFLVLAIVALPAVLGQFLQTVVKSKQTTLSLVSLVSGTFIVGLCLVIPVVGPIILVGFMVLTFGAMVDMLIRANR